MQERRHLTTCHIAAGAEPVVHRWITTAGHTGCSQLVDVALEDRTIIVGEQVTAAVVGLALIRRNPTRRSPG
jgi:hypothetical protein